MNTWKGVDLSVFNGDVDFNRMKKSGVQFAMLRAGYGRELSQKDSRFEENYRKALEVGMPVGAYWYSYAKDPDGARREADTCAQVIAGKRFAYPIAFDLEDASLRNLGRETLTNNVMAFCCRLEELGYFAMLYANLDWLRNRLIYERIGRFSIWLAQWGVERPTYAHPVGIWQYTSDGVVPGSSARTDLDLSYRDYPALIQSLGLNGFGKPGPGPEPEPEPGPVPEYPEPDYPVRRGDHNDGVRWVQQKLAQLGYDIGPYGVDGWFGDATERAVKRLQETNGLTADGVVGPATRAVLNGRNPYDEPQGNLYFGSSGEGVRWVQWALRQQGYNIDGTGIDGVYGVSTRDAVVRFQRDNGLFPDGITGVNTRAALNGRNPFDEPQENLYSGSSGEGVKWVQWALRHKGYSIGSAGIDGVYGRGTRDAVERFQRDSGLSADGVVGPDTRAALAA